MAQPAIDRDRLTALAEGVARECDCYLEELIVRQAGRRLLVQAVVGADTPLDLDTVAAVSRAFDRAIEEDGVLGEAAYTLEVTSRGTDRPLTLPRHFASNRGRLVDFTFADGSTKQGRIAEVTDSGVAIDGGETLAFDEITTAKVVLEFNRKVDASFDVEEIEGEDDL